MKWKLNRFVERAWLKSEAAVSLDDGPTFLPDFNRHDSSLVDIGHQVVLRRGRESKLFVEVAPSFEIIGVQSLLRRKHAMLKVRVGSHSWGWLSQSIIEN